MISLGTKYDACTPTFSLHQTVSVGLRNYTAADLSNLRNQIGLPEITGEAPPDIVLRYEAKTNQRPSLNYVDESTGFIEDSFFVVQGRGREKICVQIPVPDLGMECELVCPSELSTIPLLKQIIDLTALRKGVLPVHGSSFVFQGQGTMMTGVAHSAKTTTLLGFVARGAQFIGDDTAYLDDSGVMFGDDAPICLSDRHFTDLPQAKRALPYRQRLQFWSAKSLANALAMAEPAYQLGQGRFCRGLRKLDRALSGCRSMDISFDELFSPADRCSSHSMHKAFLSISHDSPDVVIKEVSLDAFVQCLTYIILQEFSPLMELYNKFRFAFPSKHNVLLDRLRWHIEKVARERLKGKMHYMVCHPYPVSSQKMFDAMSPLF